MEERWGGDMYQKVAHRCHRTGRRDLGQSRGRWKSMWGRSKGRRQEGVAVDSSLMGSDVMWVGEQSFRNVGN